MMSMLMIFVIVGLLLVSARGGMRFVAAIALVIIVGMTTMRFTNWENNGTQPAMMVTLVDESSAGSALLDVSHGIGHETELPTVLSTAQTGAVQQLDNGDMLVLPLSQDFVAVCGAVADNGMRA